MLIGAEGGPDDVPELLKLFSEYGHREWTELREGDPDDALLYSALDSFILPFRRFDGPDVSRGLAGFIVNQKSEELTESAALMFNYISDPAGASLLAGALEREGGEEHQYFNLMQALTNLFSSHPKEPLEERRRSMSPEDVIAEIMAKDVSHYTQGPPLTRTAAVELLIRTTQSDDFYKRYFGLQALKDILDELAVVGLKYVACSESEDMDMREDALKMLVYDTKADLTAVMERISSNENEPGSLRSMAESYLKKRTK